MQAKLIPLFRTRGEFRRRLIRHFILPLFFNPEFILCKKELREDGHLLSSMMSDLNTHARRPLPLLAKLNLDKKGTPGVLHSGDQIQEGPIFPALSWKQDVVTI